MRFNLFIVVVFLSCQGAEGQKLCPPVYWFPSPVLFKDIVLKIAALVDLAAVTGGNDKCVYYYRSQNYI